MWGQRTARAVVLTNLTGPEGFPNSTQFFLKLHAADLTILLLNSSFVLRG